MVNNNGRTKRRAGHSPVPTDKESAADPRSRGAQPALGIDQTLADADQSAADADQTSSDSDQTVSSADQAIADRDQLAADNDQAAADLELAANFSTRPETLDVYETSRGQRANGSFARLKDRVDRETAALERDATAALRDRTADARDESARARDGTSTILPRPATTYETTLLKEIEHLRAESTAARGRAAKERAAAARDRTHAGLERARLEAELQSAHLDPLTGAYGRQMGRVALSHEITRARRSDGRFVLAFVDVDRLKVVNDRDGHAAGDRVLQTVVRTIRTRLRSFDPIVRLGGDEFVCGLGGTDVAEAERRFASIGVTIEADARVGISVGLAALTDGDTADQLTERADAAMLEVKALHHAAR